MSKHIDDGRASLADDRESRTSKSGLFLTLEGVDGAGKTTQCALLCSALGRLGREVVRLREPGGTCVGERVRELLLDGGADISPICELLLFEAARAQLVSTVVVPALARGAVVVSDRFFDSTTAYQGYGRGLGPETVDRANAVACAGLEPDRTLFLDLDVHEAFERAAGDGPDRMERGGVPFLERVREGFAAAARENPSRIVVVDASGSIEAVWERVRSALEDLVELPAPPAGDGR